MFDIEQVAKEIHDSFWKFKEYKHNSEDDKEKLRKAAKSIHDLILFELTQGNIKIGEMVTFRLNNSKKILTGVIVGVCQTRVEIQYKGLFNRKIRNWFEISDIGIQQITLNF